MGQKYMQKIFFLIMFKFLLLHIKKKTQYDYGLLAVDDFKIDNFLIKFAKDDKSKITLNNITQLNIKKNKKMNFFG